MNAVIHSSGRWGVLIVLWVFHGSTSAFSQQDSARQFDRIFGSGPDYNGIELMPHDGIPIKHDTINCALICFDWDKQRIVWKKDLKPYGCRLLYFDDPKELHGKRYDVVIQFENKEGYLLRSKTGRMKHLVLDQQR